jgi:transposase
MTRPFSIALKQTLVARLTGVNAISAAQLARETGISQQNLSRWLTAARRSPFGAAGEGIICVWSVQQKAQIIAQSAALAGDELTLYLDGEGVSFAQFKCWRLALEEAEEESVSTAKRIARLERELIRKDSALAEAATLLWLRERIESPTQKEHDRFDEQPDEELEVDFNAG